LLTREASGALGDLAEAPLPLGAVACQLQQGEGVRVDGLENLAREVHAGILLRIEREKPIPNLERSRQWP
jgi:hypothetical protein